MNICLVYLKTELPQYVKANISYLRRTFPAEKIWLISDNDSNLEIAKKLGLNAWKCTNPVLDWEALKNSDLDLKFRDGFYSYALGRFHSLNEFMKIFPSESVLHIEADVWLAPNFPLRKIEKIQEEVAFPLEQKGVAIPSTVFIQNSLSMSRLLSFLTESLSMGRTPIDMFLLPLYREFFPNRVHILPSAVPIGDGFKLDVDLSTRNEMCSNFQYYNGIFDSSTWGQYLFGIDPKNFLGIRIIYKEQKEHAAKIRGTKFLLDPCGNLELSLNDMRIHLYSLHIHSKDVKVFLEDSRSVFRYRIDRSNSRTKYEFDLNIFLHYFSFRIFWQLVKVPFVRIRKRLHF